VIHSENGKRDALSGDFSHITRGAPLHKDDALSAIRSRGTARALLEHLVAISVSVEDAAQVLGTVALLATEDASEWVDGRLEVELVSVGDSTVIETVTSIGGGLRERLLPRLTLPIPTVELVSALERAPGSIEPLYVWHGSGGRVKLVQDASAARSARPPPPIAIAGDSLVESLPPFPPEPAPSEAEKPAPTALGDLDDPLTDLEQGWDS
jgi:hypothetical protein